MENPSRGSTWAELQDKKYNQDMTGQDRTEQQKVTIAQYFTYLGDSSP